MTLLTVPARRACRLALLSACLAIGSLTGCGTRRPDLPAPTGAPPLPIAPLPGANDALTASLRAAETAFAQTMADRDFTAFGRFVADDAVFLNGGKPLRGKPAVLAHWQKFFAGPQPPFAWRPELVEVTATGDLGATAGPVTVQHKVVARFGSTWRRNAAGAWEVVFDDGHDVCECGGAK